MTLLVSLSLSPSHRTNEITIVIHQHSASVYRTIPCFDPRLQLQQRACCPAFVIVKLTDVLALDGMAGAVVASMCTGFGTGDIKIGCFDAGRSACTEPWCSIPITKGLQLGPAPTLQEHPASCSTSSTVSMAISLLSGSISSSAAPASCMSSVCKPSSAGAAGLKHGLELSDSMQSNSASSMLCSFTPLPATSPAVLSTWHSSAALSDPSPVAPLKRLRLCSTQPPTAAGQQSSPAAVAKSSLTCPPAPKRPSPPVLLVPLSELGRYVHCS